MPIADMGVTPPPNCGVCGASEFSFSEVLWPELIADWQLEPHEAHYVNIQQGLACTDCHNNLRSITLARAICGSQGHAGTLDGWIEALSGSRFDILEINPAGLLTKHLANINGHVLVSYPSADIHKLEFSDGTFDAVIHSDTLEHVSNPVHALVECKRVLRPGGVLLFTVPMIVDRMTRSRTGLSPSYHGGEADNRQDYQVVTEFGADAPYFVLRAGFNTVTLYSDLFPASIAFSAKNG